MFQSRIIKKGKIWFGIVAICIVVYLYLRTKPPKIIKRDVTHKVLTEFTWLSLDNNTTINQCRNSIQGPKLIVDELGYVCPIVWVQSSGCCSTEHSSRFECRTCLHTTTCCAIYEHCVSCCLSSDKKPLLQMVLSQRTTSPHPLYSSVKDQFELCLAKCRTSSQSVHHENSYRNPDTKYCYGLELPQLNNPK